MFDAITLKTKVENYQLDIITGLNEICPENFEERFHLLISKVKMLNSFLSSQEYKILTSEKTDFLKITNERAKLIRETFDNVIERYRNEIDSLEEQLSETLIRKKISNYKQAPL